MVEEVRLVDLNVCSSSMSQTLYHAVADSLRGG